MSVINQLLIDLEKRRASSTERGLIPKYVHALPPVPSRPNIGWAAGGGVLVVVALAASAVMFAGMGAQSVTRPDAGGGVLPAQPIRGNNPAQPAASAAPATAEEAVGATITSVLQPAGRLSFELSTLPAEIDAGARRPTAIATNRVLTRAENSAPAAAGAVPQKAQSSGAQGAIRKTMQPEAAVTEPEIDKRVRQPTVQQLAEGEYRKATVALHAGRTAEARAGFESALQRYPQHVGARQALFGVLIEAKQMQEAERILQEGLDLAPNQIGFAMAMARLQVDRGDAAVAIETLQRSAGHAAGSPEYAAFLAALLHREKRYAEAVDQFVAALRLKPNTAVWLLGLGMSLQALDRNAEAREAFTRARAAGTLSPSLQAFVDERLAALR